MRNRSFRPFSLAFGNVCSEICGQRRGCIKEGKQSELMGEKSDKNWKNKYNCAISSPGE